MDNLQEIGPRNWETPRESSLRGLTLMGAFSDRASQAVGLLVLRKVARGALTVEEAGCWGHPASSLVGRVASESRSSLDRQARRDRSRLK
jgi:hypothetical protein